MDIAKTDTPVVFLNPEAVNFVEATRSNHLSYLKYSSSSWFVRPFLEETLKGGGEIYAYIKTYQSWQPVHEEDQNYASCKLYSARSRSSEAKIDIDKVTS